VKGLTILLLLGLLLAVTKPAKERHVQALGAIAAGDFGGKRGPARLLGQAAAAGASVFARAAMDFHDYGLFSTMTLHGDTVSVGLLGMVFKTGARSSQ